MFKVNNRNTRTRCEICSKLTIKTPERRYWCRSGVFIVYFEHISHLVLVFLLLTLTRYIPTGTRSMTSFWCPYCYHCSDVSTVDFEQVNVDWDKIIVKPFRENYLPIEFPIFCKFFVWNYIVQSSP